MKRYFSIILALVILITISACKNKEELPDASELDISDFDQTITIYIATSAGYVPSNDEVSNWEIYMKDKYKVSIDLAYIIVDGDSIDFTSSFIASENIMLVDDFFNLPNKSGLIYSEKYYMKFFRESGLISPINEFMQEIDLVKMVNDKILGSFTDVSGDVWAAPYTDKVSLPMRLYCEEWLNKAGMKVPVDLKDFRDFAEFVAFNDPDGNGENDTYIHEYKKGYQLFYSFADVFRAYGCYTGYYNPLAYNPKIGKIENVVLNENFPEAIRFIRQMQDDGLLKSGYAEQRGGRKPDYYAASMISSSVYPDYWEGSQVGYYLIGTNLSELITPQGGSSGVMVIEGTENPGGMLNILGAIAETKNGFLDMLYGIEGYNYEMMEGYCRVIVEDDNKERRNPFSLFYGSSKSYDAMMKDNIRIVTSKDLSVLETNNIIYEGFDSDNMIASLMESDIVYMTPDIVIGDKVRELERFVIEDTSLLLYNIMDNGVDIEEAIEIYRESMKTKGFFEKLDELNEGSYD